VKVRGVRVAWAPGVEVGPFDADVWPDAGGARAEVRLPAGGRVALHLRRAGEVMLGLRASGLRPAALGGLAELLPASFPAGVASLELDARAPADLSRAEAQLRADVEGLVASGGHLDREPVGPIHVAARTRVVWERSGRRLADADRGSTGALAGAVRLTDGELSLGGALRATFDAELGIEDGLPLVASLRARGIPYAAFSASLPASLGPPEAAPRPAGDLDASFSVEGPLLSPGAWTFAAELDLSRMRAAAQRASPVDLRAPFTYRPEGAPPFHVGPDNPDFVPLDALPDHVARAVTTSEDAGFFAHSGFDFAEIGNAMAEGIEAGRVVRGGSTITQQLAKNLWLSRDRLLARKVREALGAIALEATVPKDRLLEIYLNVAEWGPGVYGIGAAARHWFGKDARELTPKEAALLAAVIPSPARYDAMRARGAPTEALEQRVAEILLHMSDRGVLAHDELLRALKEPIGFAGNRAPAEAVPSSGGGG
jgi:monofunctional biosynthetic peptidoglycan transglycosylase